MGELVDLQEYRLKKEAEEEARRQAEIDKLRAEIADVMARLSLSPNNSYPIFPEEDYRAMSHDDLYFSTLWSTDYRQDVRCDDEEYTYPSCDYEDPKWYLDLRIKPLKDADPYEE